VDPRRAVRRGSAGRALFGHRDDPAASGSAAFRDGSEIAGLVDLQARLIDRALGFLKPGGRLVYATCSLLPEEGEGQLSAALARHPGLEVTPGALALPGVEAGWITPQGGLRLRPDYWADRGGMDGFFIAALRLGAGA
jgi:16S rRNA (cytosine967-C5)-methyltransferase